MNIDDEIFEYNVKACGLSGFISNSLEYEIGDLRDMEGSLKKKALEELISLTEKLEEATECVQMILAYLNLEAEI